MRFQSTSYNFVELSRTNLRRRHDPHAIKVPANSMGFLDLLRAFREGRHATWPYGSELTVLGMEQFLLNVSNSSDMAKHVHDNVLYDPGVYDALAKKDATLVIVCDGEFEVGPNTFELLVGHTRLPIGVLFVGQPQILSAGGNALGYWAPFKLSG